ncbi:MAG: LytTR family DNA-binding domain-containing protein [Bacteroidota bacterium]
MKPYRVAIVDDEPYALRNLRTMLSAYQSLEIVAECADGHQAIEELSTLQPELVFLDIQMPEMDGFGVIRQLRKVYQPYVIFATAYSEHAIKAFDVNALDYLLKPFDESRLDQAIQKAFSQLNQEGESREDLYQKIDQLLQSVQPAPTTFLRKLSVRKGNRIVLIDVKEVDWIQADNQYVRIHSKGQQHVMRNSLNALEARLDPQQFCRTHRSAIVNLDRIQAIEPHFKGEYVIHLSSGERVKLARNRKEKLQALLG